MKKIDTNPPAGTRDFLPEDAKFREKVLAIIKEVFESFGFLPIETPAIERIETLRGKYGEEEEKLIFQILKRGKQATPFGGQARLPDEQTTSFDGQALSEDGETDLALRYDLTIPLARFVVEHQTQLPPVFKRYQIAPVWRADRPGKGRFREFYQADVDIVGSSSLLSDAEVILAHFEALNRLGLSDFTIRLNSRKVLSGLLEAYQVPEEKKREVLTALDKLDKLGIEGVLRELWNREVEEEVIKKLEEDLQKSVEDVKKRLETVETGREGLKEVDSVFSLLAPLLKKGQIEFSPFLARGLDYYTGPIFEIYSKRAAGAIAGGGRYDNLIELFAQRPIPATGGSLGFERIITLLEHKEPVLNPPQAFVTVWDESFKGEALKIAGELRKNEILTEIFLGEGKIREQVGAASAHRASFCIIFGPDERDRNEVTIKDLALKKQISVTRGKLIATLLDLLKQT